MRDALGTASHWSSPQEGIALLAWTGTGGDPWLTKYINCENMDFYLNHYLLYEDVEDAASGVSAFRVSNFLGNWFIRKAMWASKDSIKSYGASLKKFYSFMAEKGLVDKDDLDVLKEVIKEAMPDWLETIAKYDDPDVDFEDIWGF